MRPPETRARGDPLSSARASTQGTPAGTTGHTPPASALTCGDATRDVHQAGPPFPTSASPCPIRYVRTHKRTALTQRVTHATHVTAEHVKAVKRAGRRCPEGRTGPV
jgi:hypothetical protein